MCSTTQFNNVMLLSGIGGLAVAALVALVYMFGGFFGNPRATTWAESEIMHVFVSLVVVGVLLFVLSTFCSMQIGELRNMTGATLPLVFKGNEVRNFY